jgi:pimeloyl-ACP methyl ester carboxylesterase
VLASWPGSILLLSAADDDLSRSSLDDLRTRYPGSRTELLEAGGHHAFLFFPAAYTAALKRFLNDVVR